MSGGSQSIDLQLSDAVMYHRVDEVRDLLAQGANPNFSQGPPDVPPKDEIAPALNLCVFRISDCMLKDDDIEDFAVIADMLVQAGAETASALELAVERYGKDSVETPEVAAEKLEKGEIQPFDRVLLTIAAGKR